MVNNALYTGLVFIYYADFLLIFKAKYPKNTTFKYFNPNNRLKMAKKCPVTLYLDKELISAIENNYNEIEEFDGITKFKAFCGSKSQFYTLLLSLGLKEYSKQRNREIDEMSNTD